MKILNNLLNILAVVQKPSASSQNLNLIIIVVIIIILILIASTFFSNRK